MSIKSSFLKWNFTVGEIVIVMLNWQQNQTSKQNPRYQGGGFPVAKRFNLPENNQVHDMRVSVVRQVKGGTVTRQREERRLIFQLGTLVPKGLNIDFKFF